MSKSWRVVLLVFLVASACGTNETNTGAAGAPIETTPPDSAAVEPDNLGGFGAPSQAAGEFDDAYSPYTVTGSLDVEANGCWYIKLNGVKRLLAFPEGFTFADSDTTTMVNTDGIEFGAADMIDGITDFRPESALPGGSSGRWGNYLTFCDPTLRELAVFDTMTTAVDPTELSEADIATLVGSAVFDQHWPCGRGFAVSTADERVGIQIYQTNDQQPTAGETVVLPNPGWKADVVIGKHLFVSHCNDAIEEWMPERIEVGLFPISGNIVINDDVPVQDDAAAVVTATLETGSVTIGSEDVQLPSVDLVNTHYNFFAG